MEEEAHKALYAALTENPGGITLRDHVPESDEPEDDGPFPYTVIGEGNTVPQDTDDTRGADVYFDLRIFSRYKGWKEADGIAQTIRDRLHMQLLVVDGYACWDVLCENAERVPETSTNQTREVRVRVNVRLDET